MVTSPPLKPLRLFVLLSLISVAVYLGWPASSPPEGDLRIENANVPVSKRKDRNGSPVAVPPQPTVNGEQPMSFSPADPAELAKIMKAADELHQAALKMADPGLTPPDNTQLQRVIHEAEEAAATDPKAAFDWATKQGEQAASAMAAVLDIWAVSDPAAAYEAMKDLVPDKNASNLRANGLSRVASQWAKTDPSKAWSAVGTLPPSIESALLKETVMREWAPADPEAAAQQLQNLAGEEGKYQSWIQSSYTQVAALLAAKDSKRALSWAQSFPEGSPERASAVSGVVYAWSTEDPAPVVEWLSQMEKGSAQDQGLALLIAQRSADAPETRLNLAQSISSDPLRQTTRLQIAARWLQTDPETAKEWIQKASDLDQAQRATLLANAQHLAKPK